MGPGTLSRLKKAGIKARRSSIENNIFSSFVTFLINFQSVIRMRREDVQKITIFIQFNSRSPLPQVKLQDLQCHQIF
jgi:hypothetical protein